MGILPMSEGLTQTHGQDARATAGIQILRSIGRCAQPLLQLIGHVAGLAPRIFARPCRLAVPLTLAALATPLAAAADPESAPPAPVVTSMREDLLRMNEFFDTTLPGTLKKYNIVMEYTPKFVDFRDHEYIRFPVEIRYGVREHWELYGGLTPFIPNPFNSGIDHRWGPGFARLGVRHDVGGFFGLYDQVTVGLETRAPLGQPPLFLIDRYSHIRPFIAAARKLPWPNTTFLTSYSYDRAMDTPGRGTPPAELPRVHILEIAPSLLYKPGEFGGFAEYTYRHFQEELKSHLGHEYKVGSVWDVPLVRSQAWRLPGKWQVELAYRITDEQGVGRSRGIAMSLRWRTTLREMLYYNPGNPLPSK
jgi:hypothetical protein